MKALVFVKQVPDINAISFDNKTKRIIRTGVKLMFNSYDKKAVEAAINLSEKYDIETYVASMGPPSAVDVINDSMKMGIKHGILISDRKFGGSDTYITSRILSEVISIIKPDIVLTGKASLDGETSQVPPEIAFMSGYNFQSNISKIEINGNKLAIVRDEENGFNTIEIDMPAVLSVSEKINKARPVPENAVIEDITYYDSTKIDENGINSPTEVIDTFHLEDSRENSFINFNTFTEILNNALNSSREKHEYKIIKPPAGNGIFLALAIDNASMAMQICSRIAEISDMKIIAIGNIDPEKVSGMACHEYIFIRNADNLFIADYVSKFIKNNNVKHVIAPSNLNGRDIASFIAANLGLGLTADCVDVRLDGGKLLQLKPAFGGGIVATIVSKTVPDISSVREGMFMTKYINNNFPVKIVNGHSLMNAVSVKFENNKIDSALNTPVIFGIGMGVKKENIPDILDLASSIGASAGSTRRVVDAGLMPGQSQIGLTGKAVSPELYIAIGISGSDKHISGLRYAKKIVAVNISENAPVFKHSDYGIIADSGEFIKDLRDYLCHKIS